MSTPGGKLNKRQESFCIFYAIDHIGSKAALRAGYSEANCRQTASRLLTEHNIQDRIAELDAETVKRAKIDADWIIDKLVQNALKGAQAVPVLDSEGKETGTFTYQGAVVNRALELLGRNYGLFTERVEVRKISQVTVDILHERAARGDPARLEAYRELRPIPSGFEDQPDDEEQMTKAG